MKVNNSSIAGNISTRSGDGRVTSGAKSAPAGDTSAADATTLSGVAEATRSEPTFDAGRVAAIRQAISEGRFSVHPEAIADGLINSVQSFLKG